MKDARIIGVGMGNSRQAIASVPISEQAFQTQIKRPVIQKVRLARVQKAFANAY
jgi:hypothetical protein